MSAQLTPMKDEWNLPFIFTFVQIKNLMKSFLTLLLAALAFAATAQPQKIHYQGVAVGANGKPIKNSPVGLRLSVLDSLPTGSTLYSETQIASTDAAGMFSIYLGAGTATTATFANLPWANGNDKFLKVEMDAQGGSNYQPMGTTQLVSVPYAMAANQISDQNGTSIQIKYDENGNPFVAIVRKPIPGCGQSVNYAGEIYPTVQIGNQCWFSKNLNIGNMINSSSSVDSQLNNGILEKYCYNNDSVNCSVYGGLYQWAEAVQYQNGATNGASPNPVFSGQVKGICPTGWHLPSDVEWSYIENALGGSTVAGGAMKSTNSLWTTPNTGATNSSGFAVLPSGYRSTSGNFSFINNYPYFWSSTENSSIQAQSRYLHYNFPSVYRNFYSKLFGFSVRCVKD